MDSLAIQMQSYEIEYPIPLTMFVSHLYLGILSNTFYYLCHRFDSHEAQLTCENNYEIERKMSLAQKKFD